MKYPWEILILFMVLAITFIVMLLLYWLISKRILYNIPIGEKIFLFQNDYAYISLNKFELLCHLLLSFPLQNIFINNINHLTFKIYIYLTGYQNSNISTNMLLWCVCQRAVLTYVQKGYVVIDLVIIWY